MSGGVDKAVLIRKYQARDRVQIESFVCVPPGQRWRLVAQEIIRESPEECEVGNAEIFVAVEEPEVLGVIVSHADPQGEPKWEICSIGVVIPRQNQGIGQSLKRAVIAEIVARSGPREFISTVHRLNGPMIAINRKLEAEMMPDPLDGEHLLTLVRAEPLIPGM